MHGGRERVRREEAEAHGVTGESMSRPSGKKLYRLPILQLYAECVSFSILWDQ